MIGKIMDKQRMILDEQLQENRAENGDVYYDNFGFKWKFLAEVKDKDAYTKLCCENGVSNSTDLSRLYRSRRCLVFQPSKKIEKIGCDYRLLLVRPTKQCSEFLGKVYFRGEHKHPIVSRKFF